MTPQELLEAKAIEAAEAKYGKLDLLASAFVGETGFKPSECELVEDHRNNTVVFYFRRRGYP